MTTLWVPDTRKAQKKIAKVFGKIPETLDEVATSAIKVFNKYNKHNKILALAWHVRRNEHIKDFSWPEENLQSGFEGRIWFILEQQESMFSGGANFSEVTLLQPCTGGYGHYDGPFEFDEKVGKHTKYYPLSYHFKFFDNDWKGLQTYLQELATRNFFAKRQLRVEHKFVWKAN